MLTWPSSFFTAYKLRSGDFIMWVATVWRNRCGVIVNLHSRDKRRKNALNGYSFITSGYLLFLIRSIWPESQKKHGTKMGLFTAASLIRFCKPHQTALKRGGET